MQRDLRGTLQVIIVMAVVLSGLVGAAAWWEKRKWAGRSRSSKPGVSHEPEPAPLIRGRLIVAFVALVGSIWFLSPNGRPNAARNLPQAHRERNLSPLLFALICALAAFLVL